LGILDTQDSIHRTPTSKRQRPCHIKSVPHLLRRAWGNMSRIIPHPPPFFLHTHTPDRSTRGSYDSSISLLESYSTFWTVYKESTKWVTTFYTLFQVKWKAQGDFEIKSLDQFQPSEQFHRDCFSSFHSTFPKTSTRGPPRVPSVACPMKFRVKTFSVREFDHDHVSIRSVLNHFHTLAYLNGACCGLGCTSPEKCCIYQSIASPRPPKIRTCSFENLVGTNPYWSSICHPGKRPSVYSRRASSPFFTSRTVKTWNFQPDPTFTNSYLRKVKSLVWRAMNKGRGSH
jgi:hypothetical protein